MGIRTGAGAIAGGVSGTVSETVRALKGEDVSPKSFAKSVGIGALAGSVGGASTHLGSNLSKGMSDVGRAMTRMSVQASAAAATDASLQLIDKGEIDTKQLLLNTAGQLTVAATTEITQSFSRPGDHYNKKLSARDRNGKFTQRKGFSNQIRPLPDQIAFLSPKDIEAIMRKVTDSGKARERIQKPSMLTKSRLQKFDHPETHGRPRNHRRLSEPLCARKDDELLCLTPPATEF